jgi:hypothetical protein
MMTAKIIYRPVAIGAVMDLLNLFFNGRDYPGHPGARLLPLVGYQGGMDDLQETLGLHRSIPLWHNRGRHTPDPAI